MPSKAACSYDLIDLHKEIDYFDRKIAYCQTLEKFDSEGERANALQKLNTKRGTLVKAAQEAASRGIQCDGKYLPRSLKEAATKERHE